jgi:hypothetical protein
LGIFIGPAPICHSRGGFATNSSDPDEHNHTHILPESGWVTVPLRTATEVRNVIELFRDNYERSGLVRPPSG